MDDDLPRCIATSGAALLIFVGICHEAVGATLYPWGPSLFGGRVGWHLGGALIVISGMATWLGAAGLLRFPVAIFGSLAIVGGGAVAAVAAVVHQQWHVFALAALIGGLMITFAPRLTMAPR